MQTFSKDERLCSKLLLSALLEKGTSFFVHPFRIIWLETEHPGKHPVQIAISVSKKRFKKAVDRNKVKRAVREAYRQNKQELYDAMSEKGRKGLLLLVYSINTQPVHSEVESKIKLILQRLIKENEKSA
jgi:ribonuclease P protein component